MGWRGRMHRFFDEKPYSTWLSIMVKRSGNVCVLRSNRLVPVLPATLGSKKEGLLLASIDTFTFKGPRL